MSQESATLRGLARWATALVAMGGLFVAWYLTEFHIQSVVGDTVGGALCDAHQAVDCESAVHSSYSELFGIPISLLGVAFYAAVLGLVFFDRQSVRESSQPFRTGAIASTTFGIGAVYSLFLAGVSFFDLQTFCPFCVMLYAVNVIGFVTASMWAGEKPHRVVLAQIQNPRDFFNGWTGLFAFGFAVTLMAGTSVIGTEVQNRLAEQSRTDSEVEAMPVVDPEDYRIDDAPAKGPEDAPVHIVEFSTFTCPFCGELASVLDGLSNQYPEEVRVEFRHFPMPSQPAGHLSARASFCAEEQGSFWEMHDRLFDNMSSLERENIDQYAEDAGLDMAEFSECVDSDRARERVDEDVAAGNRLGIEGTPTFFINGHRIEGVRSPEMMEAMVEEALQNGNKPRD